MNVLNPFVIFSAMRAEADEATNMHKHAVTKVTLANLGFAFKEVEGVYKGVAEKSFVVIVNSDSRLKAVIEMAASLEQESILHVDSTRNATLLFSSGDVKPLGRFVSVSEDVATKEDAYTRDGSNYYVCA